jgi:hypothetical protein
MKKLFRSSVFWEVLCIFLLSLLPLLWFQGNQVLLGHDSGFRLDIKAHLQNVFYSWDSRLNFGYDISQFKGFLITHAFEGIVGSIFGFLVGERMTLIFWFFAMGISMYIFLYQLFQERDHWFIRVFGSIFYIVNFYILQAWFIAERAKFSLYIALPLTLLLFYNVWIKRWSVFYSGFLFGLLFFLFNGGGSPPLFGAIFVMSVLFALYLTLYEVIQNGISGLFLSLKVAIWFPIVFLFMNAYWIASSLSIVLQSYSVQLGSRGGTEGFVAWEREIGKFASFINLVRLQGVPDWYNNPVHAYANFFLSNPVLIVASFLPFGIILLGLIFRGLKDANNGQRVLLSFLVFELIIGMFFTAGSHPPFGSLYLLMLRHIPGFVLFRSSFYKFAPAMWFPIVVLSSYFLELGIQFFIKKRVLQYFAGGICILGLLAYHYPYFEGKFFQFDKNFSTKVTVPKYVFDMSTYIGQHVSVSERIFIVPEFDRGYIDLPLDAYTWGYFSLDMLPRNAKEHTFVGNDAAIDYYVGLLFKSIRENDIQTFLRLARNAGITHILWRSDIAYSTEAQKNKMDLIQKVLDATKEFSVVYESGAWKLYKIALPSVKNQLSVSGVIDIVNPPNDHEAALTNLSYPLGNEITLQNPNEVIRKEIQDNVRYKYTELECFFCKKDEYRNFLGGIVISKQNKWNIPFLKDRAKKKELQVFQSVQGKPGQTLDADIAYGLMRLGEVVFETKNIPVDQTVDEYKNFMSDAISQLEALGDRDKNSYLIRLIAYLEKEKILLEPYKDQNSIAELIRWIDTILDDFAKHEDAWKSDASGYKYGVTVEKTGEYQLFTPGFSQIFPLTVDGIERNTNDTLFLEKGFHKIALTDPKILFQFQEDGPIVYLRYPKSGKPITMPSITYMRNNPTLFTVHIKDAVEPFILEFDQQFDPGWRAYIRSSANQVPFFKTPISEDMHIKINGLTNGWYIQETGSYDLVISYWPQQIFYIGMGISFISLSIVVVILILFARKKFYAKNS